MRRGICIAVFNLILLSGFMGCHNESRHVDIISRDTLIEILADLHIADGALHVDQAAIPAQHVIRRNAYFDWVMHKHHITYQSFDTSFKFYLNDTERFSKMYDLVINRIKEKELENKRTPKEELIRKDSLKKDSINRVAIQKAAFKKDSIRQDSIKKINLKLAAIQRAQFKKDSILKVVQKRIATRKEAILNESLKRSLSQKDTIKKDTVKKKKVVPPFTKKKTPALVK